MNKHTLLFLMLILIPLCLKAEDIKTAQKLKVGVYDNPPKIFINDTGKPDGIFIDIIKEIAKNESITLEFIPGNWSGLLEMLLQGEIDVLPDMAYSDERDSLFVFSLPVLSSWLQPYNTSATVINNPSDLQNKRVGVLKASSQENYVKNNIKRDNKIEFQVLTYDTYTQSVQALKNNEIDALIANRFFYFSDLCDEEILASGIVMQISELHFAFSPKAPTSIINLVNKNITLLRTDPHSAYYQTLQKWLNKHKNRIPFYVKWLIALLAMAFLIVLLFTVILRSKVKAKTRELSLQNNELIVAKLKAEESDRLKTAFLQNLSHEIRTPLNGILGFVTIVQDPEFNDERRHQFIEIIKTSSERLLSTINDIIEISKLDANQVEIKRSDMNVRETLELHFNLFNEKVRKKGLTFKLTNHLSSENEIIFTDRLIFDGVISRLLNNALKFTNEGSIELGVYPEDSFVVFYVKDTGTGIPADRLEAIFERFVSADLNLSRSYDGSGLGLAIVRSYLELLNGEIRVESETGMGSVFFFKLPVLKIT